MLIPINRHEKKHEETFFHNSLRFTCVFWGCWERGWMGCMEKSMNLFSSPFFLKLAIQLCLAILKPCGCQQLQNKMNNSGPHYVKHFQGTQNKYNNFNITHVPHSMAHIKWPKRIENSKKMRSHIFRQVLHILRNCYKIANFSAFLGKSWFQIRLNWALGQGGYDVFFCVHIHTCKAPHNFLLFKVRAKEFFFSNKIYINTK